MHRFCWLDIWEEYFYEKTEKRKFYNRSGIIDAVDSHGGDGASVMSIVLLTVMGVIYLSFFVHNRAWLTSAAYEAAVSGSMEGYKKDGDIYEKADIQGRMLGSTGLPGGENLSMQTSAGKNVQVTYQMDVPAGFLSQKWKIEVCGKAAVLRPTGWIRKVKGTVEVLEEVKK